MSHLGAFWNELVVGPPPSGGLGHFRTDDNDDGIAFVNHTIPAGYYFFDTLRNALLVLIATDIGAIRIGINAAGYVTIDNNGGTNFRLVWNDLALRAALGFSSTLTGANSYTGSRQIGASWRPSKPAARYNPKPAGIEVAHSIAMSGAESFGVLGDEREVTPFEFHAIDNMVEYTSPAGSFGTSYSGSGITEYVHARDLWWRLVDPSSGLVRQGWRNGRPVRYFHDRDSAVVALGAGAVVLASGFTTWRFDPESCTSWENVAREVHDLTILYDLAWRARQYVAG